MTKLVYLIHYVLCGCNKAKTLATLALRYYKQMKAKELCFHYYRSALLAYAADTYTTHTLYGRVRVQTLTKAQINTDKLAKYVPVNKLVGMSALRVNLIMKYLGNEFDKVVDKWYTTKCVLFDHEEVK